MEAAMTQGPVALICPKGHTSTEPDYCSECGAKIEGATASTAASSASTSTAQVCPDCGTTREQSGIAFCEVCGYNFSTGAHGELSGMAVFEAAAPALPTGSAASEDPQTRAPKLTDTDLRWAVVVSVDPSLRKPESPELPPDFVPFTVELDRPASLIGRTNEARAIFPEVPLNFDEAVSRRHALLEKNAAGALLLRDIGSANGTRLNGTDLSPMTDTPLKGGDEITLGHWTRLTVQATA